MTESDPLDPRPTDPPNQLPAIISPGVLTSPINAYAATLVPALIADAGDAASWRYVEFFTANIRNPNTRRAYARACAKFFAWCEVLRDNLDEKKRRQSEREAAAGSELMIVLIVGFRKHFIGAA